MKTILTTDRNFSPLSILFLLIMMGFGQILPAQVAKAPRFPSYYDVLEKFESTYSIPKGNYEFTLEKRPQGWQVNLTSSGEPYKAELFWERSSEEWKKLDFPGKLGGVQPAPIPEWKANRYGYCPYYGYPGWAEDVINEYGTPEEGIYTLLYGIGLAWSEHAGNLLHNNSGNSSDAVQFEIPEGKNKLQKSQVETYMEARGKAALMFERTMKSNLLMGTLVGSIRTKWSNAFMTQYLDLAIFKKEKIALKDMPKDLYDPFLLSWAETFLQSCPPNAILFTNGDNDTYIPLYLQVTRNIRPDVAIVNLSLLNYPRYVEYVRSGTKAWAGVPFTFSTEEVANPRFSYAILDFDNAQRTVPSVLQDVHKQLAAKEFTKEDYLKIGSNSFAMANAAGEDFSFSIESPYVLRSDMLVLDLLIANNWKRPIVYANSVAPSGFLGLREYAEQRGMVVNLLGNEPAFAHPFMKGGYDLEGSQLLFTETFKWDGFRKLLPADLYLMENTRFEYISLGAAQVDAENFPLAIAALDKCRELFPDKVHPYNISYIVMAEAYYEAGAAEKGDEVLMDIFEHLRTGAGSKVAPEYAVGESQRTLVKERIQGLLERFDRYDLLDDFEAALMGEPAPVKSEE